MKKMALAAAAAVVVMGAVPAQAGTSGYSGSILAEDVPVTFKVKTKKKKKGKKTTKVTDVLVEGVEADCEGEAVPLNLAADGPYKVKKKKFSIEETVPFTFTFRFDGALTKGGKATGTTEFFGTVEGFGEPQDERYCEVSERFWTAQK